MGRVRVDSLKLSLDLTGWLTLPERCRYGVHLDLTSACRGCRYLGTVPRPRPFLLPSYVQSMYTYRLLQHCEAFDAVLQSRQVPMTPSGAEETGIRNKDESHHSKATRLPADGRALV